MPNSSGQSLTSGLWQAAAASDPSKAGVTTDSGAKSAQLDRHRLVVSLPSLLSAASAALASTPTATGSQVSSRLRFPQTAAADMRAAKYRERERQRKREERERQSRPGSKLCISSKYHCLLVVLLTPG